MGACGNYSAFCFWSNRSRVWGFKDGCICHKGLMSARRSFPICPGVPRANHGPNDSNAVSPTITPHLASPVNLLRSVMENSNSAEAQPLLSETPAKKGRRGKRDASGDDSKKRRCISSACVPCRKRKSKVGHVRVNGTWPDSLSPAHNIPSPDIHQPASPSPSLSRAVR
jgi:hypothetical protein